MNSPSRRVFRVATLAACIAGVPVLGSCQKNTPPAAAQPRPRTQPEPFTGSLQGLDGVQALVTMRPPKAVVQDIGKLTTAVPEAGMLQMVLSQLAVYGYPDFPDIAAGSNVGMAILPGNRLIGFAKPAGEGKLLALLGRNNLAVQRHGDWALFAKDDATIGELKSADAVIALLEAPQEEDIKFLGWITPETIARVRKLIDVQMEAKLAGHSESLRKAAPAYVDAVCALAGQVHSGGISLTLGDDGLRLIFSSQMLPDSPIGTFLRYPACPPSAVEKYASEEALATVVIRQDPDACRDVVDSVLNAFIAVDYPPVSARLKELKSAYESMTTGSDGASVMLLGLAPPTGDSGAKAAQEYFSVASGHFDPVAVKAGFRKTLSLTDEFTKYALSRPELRNASAKVRIEHSYAENALNLDGVAFDCSTTDAFVDDRKLSRTTRYIGVTGEGMVTADSEATLKKRLSGAPAGAAATNAKPAPGVSHELARMELNGGPLVDLFAQSAKLDLADEATKAQINALKSGFAGSPVSASFTSGQARATETLVIPYAFIGTSVRMVGYASTKKFNFMSLFGNPPAQPPGR